MKRKRKLTNQRRGAVLMTVTIITCMMVIIVGAGISLVDHTKDRSNDEYRKKQAYFAAQSCLEAFVSQNTDFTIDATHTAEEVEQSITRLLAYADSGEEVTVNINEAGSGTNVKSTQARWNDIDCRLRVERVGGDDSTTLKAVSTATYLGETKQVVAYMSIEPLSARKAPTRALEVIGTNGGGNASYNNIRVYGNSGAIDQKSHDKNTMYDASTNNCKLYGDCLIRGSFSAGVQLQLGLNPYYVLGVNDSETAEGSQTPGCSIAVTRTLNLRNNSAKITSQLPKGRSKAGQPGDIAPRGNDAYNFVYTGEALVMQGDSGTYIGQDPDHMVDVYTSLLYVGKLANDSDVADRIMSSLYEAQTKPELNISADDVTRYRQCLVGDGSGGFYSGQGQEQTICGNIYTENKGPVYNGDIIFNGLHTHVKGDIYCDGDIMGYGDVDVDGDVYMTGSVSSPSIGSRMTVTGNIYTGTDAETARSSSKRAKPPVVPSAKEDCYKYFPEHMLVGGTASKIKNTYASLYEADMKTLKSDSSLYINSQPIVTSVNQNLMNYSDSSEEIRLVTNSCIVDKFGRNDKNCTYIVDLDAAPVNADGRHDVVLLIKNTGIGEQFVGNNTVKVLVNCHSFNADGEPDRFCYIVTDSGCDPSWVSDQTASNPDEVSTYAHNSFNRPDDATLAYYRNDYANYLSSQGLPASSAYNADLGHEMIDGPVLYAGNGKILLMEYDTYIAYINNGTINPTDREDIVADQKLNHGYICMIFPEGSYIAMGQQSILQASIYCPRATFKWINDAPKLNLIPDPSAATYPAESHPMNINVNVMGCLICGNFQSSANNNHVVYQQVSSESMLPLAKGPGKSIADKAFKLLRYDWN